MKNFTRHLTISHLCNLKSIYEKKGIDNLYSKVCVSLLRYCDIIRIDKVFYDAGTSCQKQVSQINFSFQD